MAASDHLHPGQLRAFMPAGELRDKTYPTDVAGYRTESARKDRQTMWRDKLATTKATGFYDNVKQHGVQDPVHLVHDGGRITGKPRTGARAERPDLVSGHHRVAAAANISRNMLVPVQHHASYEDYEEHVLQNPEDNPNWKGRG